MGSDQPVPATIPRLVVRTQEAERTLPAGPTYIIGRDPASDIVINDDRVSWQHAFLRLDHGSWVLVDAGSLNGTYVGPQRMTRVLLEGDITIRLAHPSDGPTLVCSTAAPAQRSLVPIVAVSLAPDASLVLAFTRDGVVRTWRHGTAVSTRRSSASIGGPAAAAVSGPVVRVVWAVEGAVRLYEYVPGARPRRLDLTAPAPVRALALSPSGDAAVLACSDGTLRALDVRTQKYGWTLATSAPAEAVAMARDGGPVVTAFADGTIRRYAFDAGTSDIVGMSPVPARALAVTPDGETVVTGGGPGVLFRWDRRTGVSPQRRILDTAEITAVAVDRTGDKVLIGTDNGRLWLADFTGGPDLEYIIPATAPAAKARSTPAFPAEAPAAQAPYAQETTGPLYSPYPGPLVDDDVGITVYRPPVVSRGQWASLLVFVHKTTPVVEPGRGLVDPQEQVAARARAHFGGAPPSPRGGDAARPIARGDRLRIVPDLPGIECNPKSAEAEWWEPVHEVPFRLRAGPELAGRAIRGAVRVWCGLLILCEVSFTIRVAASDLASAPPPNVVDFARRYRKIFPSYSHRDSAVVANFAAVARTLGDEYLQDVLALRAGERWHPHLRQLIEEADVFQLFWSRNSMRSQHCRDEWEHALRLQRAEFVLPVYWEEPLPADPGQGLPPKALAVLHFVRWQGAEPEPAPRAASPGPVSARPARPELVLSDTVIDLGRLPQHGRSPEHRVRISNAGGGDLNARAVTPASWLRLRQAGDELVVAVDTSAPGEHEGTITIDSDGGTATVRVHAQVDPAPPPAPGAAAPTPAEPAPGTPAAAWPEPELLPGPEPARRGGRSRVEVAGAVASLGDGEQGAAPPPRDDHPPVAQRRRWQVALGAAAGIVLIGGGIGVGIAAAPQDGPPPAPPLALTGQVHSATDPGTGVAGTIGLVAKAWGTQVTLDLSKVHGPAECELVAMSRTGERRVVMGWLVTAPGDGVPGHPAHLVLRGGTSIPRNDLSRVDVDVVNGRTLVSIPV
jgi:hypothetical protein